MHHHKTYHTSIFSKIGLIVKTVRTNIFVKMASCLNLQLLIVTLNKLILLNTHHRITSMYIKFQQNRISRSLKTVHTHIYLQMIASCINLQPPIIILKNLIFLDMHHHKTYMSINFQQNQVNRSVISVHTNLFASCISLQLPIVILKKSIISDMCHRTRHVYQFFSKIGLVDQSKRCSQLQ